jgi:hypothetical protein
MGFLHLSLPDVGGPEERTPKLGDGSRHPDPDRNKDLLDALYQRLSLEFRMLSTILLIILILLR